MDFTLDSMKKVHVTVTTKSDRIAVEFDRPVGEKGNQTISYDLVGGIFEIDGYQLLKSDRVTSACLERLDYGFKCPELFELLKELMASEVEGLADSLPYIRKAKDQEGVEPHGLSSCFLELALANRFRGYPAAFYKNLFDTPDLAWSNKPELRPCTCLPLHYEDLQSHFDSSGLPRTEPIRQLAFQQPLFIAYARDMRETPFKDPDIIVDVLSQDDALRHLHNFQIALASTTELIWQRQSAFTYLRATRNERELWLLLKNQEQELGSYWCYCEFASVPHESTCATADEMPTEEAFDFLKDAVEDSWTACLGDE